MLNSPEGLRPKEIDPQEVPLFSVEENWEASPELPLAHQDAENLITDESLWEWIDTVRRLAKNGYFDSDSLFKGANGEEVVVPLMRELLDEYHSLRFLSPSFAARTMKAIGSDVAKNFSPERTLIYIESEKSSDYFYRNHLKSLLPDFGTAGWSNSEKAIVQLSPGKYEGSVEQAETILYIDDWALSGMQLAHHIWPIIPSEKLYSYHLVVSDAARELYVKHGFRGKTAGKVIGDDGSGSFFGNYRIYGYHKIPDVLPEIFAESIKHYYPVYSIFPNINGDRVGKHSRLVRY